MSHILLQQSEGPSLHETTEKIVNELKSRGIFDSFRKDCLADVDTRPAYQNLRQRVENAVTSFLGKQKWTPGLNRNQLRERLRKHLTDSRFLEIGVDRIVDQVVDRNIYTTYMPQIHQLVNETLDVKDDKEEKLDDDVEMEDASTMPTDHGNPFGTWANQFHARVPDPPPAHTGGDSSMSISSASNESAPAAADSDACDSPDIRAQMSPLSDDGKQGWGSFLGKTGDLDFSGIMHSVGRIDPAIDQMIKLELETAPRESDLTQRTSSANSNVSPEDGDADARPPPPPPLPPLPPVDLHNFVGPPDEEVHEVAAQHGGESDRHYRDSDDGRGGDRDVHRLPPVRPPRESDRGRAESSDDRRRRERARHDDRHRRDRDRDRDRDRERERGRDRDRDRDRDDHEQQRDRGRHHQRRDRDDDGGGAASHRTLAGRSGGHGHGGSRRDGERPGSSAGSGQRHHGYGNGRSAATAGSPQQYPDRPDETVKSEPRDGAKKAADGKQSTSPAKSKELSASHKKSLQKKSSGTNKLQKGERVTTRHGTPSGVKKPVSVSDKSSVSVDRESPSPNRTRRSEKQTSSTPTVPSGIKPVVTLEETLSSECKEPASRAYSSSDRTSHSTKPSSKEKSTPSPNANSSSSSHSKKALEGKTTSLSAARDSKSPSGRAASPSKPRSPDSGSASRTKPAPFAEVAPLPLPTEDRMAQLMEKYAPHLRERWQTAPAVSPKSPQHTYAGERVRPVSPSECRAVRELRRVIAEPDSLSVSSVDTADLSDFDDRLELELELTPEELAALHRLGWRSVDADDTPLDLDDGDESVDSGFNRSDTSSSGSTRPLVDAEEHLSTGSRVGRLVDDEETSAADAGRRRKRVDYIALNSGLDGESAAALAPPTGRRRRRRDRAAAGDGDWSPANKRARGWVAAPGRMLPHVALHRLPAASLAGKLDADEWHTSDRENLDGLTQLRDPGAAGDSVRIRPNLAI